MSYHRGGCRFLVALALTLRTICLFCSRKEREDTGSGVGEIGEAKGTCNCTLGFQWEKRNWTWPADPTSGMRCPGCGGLLRPFWYSCPCSMANPEAFPQQGQSILISHAFLRSFKSHGRFILVASRRDKTDSIFLFRWTSWFRELSSDLLKITEWTESKQESKFRPLLL